VLSRVHPRRAYYELYEATKSARLRCSSHHERTLYNVISEDGFVARPDGNEDFIPDELWDFFIKLLRTYDTMVISSKTYEAQQAYDPKQFWPWKVFLSPK